MLVERREEDRVGLAALHGRGGELERLEGGAARGLVRLAEHRLPALHPVVRQQGGAAVLEAQVVESIDPERIELHARRALARGQHHGVGDQQHARGVQVALAREQLHGHLGADAAGVAEQYGDAGPGGDRVRGLRWGGHVDGIEMMKRGPHSALMLASRTSWP
ncbi:hypothetical protein FQZ97_1042220 [compost metagenome]